MGIALASGVLLAGCSATPIDTSQAEPVALAPAVKPAPDCLGVTQATVRGLQWGVDERQPGLTVASAAAIVNPAEGTNSWFVAAKMVGPGMGDDTIGVWYTLQDPTAAEGDSIAFVSVDGIAAEFSVYVQPANFSAAIDGVDEARACVSG